MIKNIVSSTSENLEWQWHAKHTVANTVEFYWYVFNQTNLINGDFLKKQNYVHIFAALTERRQICAWVGGNVPSVLGITWETHVGSLQAINLRFVYLIYRFIHVWEMGKKE